jgi:hypothetical protein
MEEMPSLNMPVQRLKLAILPLNEDRNTNKMQQLDVYY